MDTTPNPSESNPTAGDDRIVARRVELLECSSAQSVTGRHEKCVTFLLGDADGSIDRVAVTVKEAKTLLHRLALAVSLETLAVTPGNVDRVTRRWLIPHTIFRAELNVEGSGTQYLRELKEQMLEVGDYVEDNLEGLRRSLYRMTESRITADRLLNRVQRFVLIAIDAARTGT